MSTPPHIYTLPYTESLPCSSKLNFSHVPVQFKPDCLLQNTITCHTVLHQKKAYTHSGTSGSKCVHQILLLPAHAYIHFVLKWDWMHTSICGGVPDWVYALFWCKTVVRYCSLVLQVPHAIARFGLIIGGRIFNSFQSNGGWHRKTRSIFVNKMSNVNEYICRLEKQCLE